MHRAELHGLMTRKPVRDALADELATLATGIRELGRCDSRQEMLERPPTSCARCSARRPA